MNKFVKTLLATGLILSSQGAFSQQQSSEDKSGFENPYYDESIQLYSDEEIVDKGRQIWMDKRFPITPDDVKTYIKRSKALEKAFKTNLNTKLTKASFIIDPDDAQSFHEVVISPGFDTVISFWDSSGKPWPIDYKKISNSAQFIAEIPQEAPIKNTITLSSNANFARTSLTVLLENEYSPLVFQLTTSDVHNQDVAHGKVSVRVQKRGPMATSIDPIYVNKEVKASSLLSDTLLRFLDNLPVKGAVRLETTPNDDSIKVWAYKGSFFIKTNHSLEWPPTTAIQPGENGSKVYRTSASRKLRMSNNQTGRVQNYKVKYYGE